MSYDKLDHALSTIERIINRVILFISTVLGAGTVVYFLVKGFLAIFR